MSGKKTSTKITAEDAIRNLESKFDEGMKSFQARLDDRRPDVSQLVEDFNQFKDFVKSALITLKSQVASLTELTDELDNRSRCK